MSEQGKPPIWEEYEDYEERHIDQGGGGGRKKERSSTSVTSRAARKSFHESAKEKREEIARQKIFTVLRHFPKPDTDPDESQTLKTYTDWLEGAMQSEESVLPDREFQVEFMRSKTKAGGQNVNKVNSAVRITHLPTKITMRSDASRDQYRNREDAMLKLKSQLQEHISDWKEVIGSQDTFGPLHVKYFYLAAHSPSVNPK